MDQLIKSVFFRVLLALEVLLCHQPPRYRKQAPTRPQHYERNRRVKTSLQPLGL